MQRKLSEAEFAHCMAHYNVWCHKWRDVMYCPRCKQPIFMTNHTDQSDQRTQPESIVDYMIVVANQLSWVECKQDDSSFAFDNKTRGILPKQRAFLDSWEARGVPTWLWIMLGDGDPRKSMRRTWLIPWPRWQVVEQELVEIDIHSLPMVPNERTRSKVYNARDMLKFYEVAWAGQSLWTIHPEHPFVYQYPNLYTLPPLYEETPHANPAA